MKLTLLPELTLTLSHNEKRLKAAYLAGKYDLKFISSHIWILYIIILPYTFFPHNFQQNVLAIVNMYVWSYFQLTINILYSGCGGRDSYIVEVQCSLSHCTADAMCVYMCVCVAPFSQDSCCTTSGSCFGWNICSLVLQTINPVFPPVLQSHLSAQLG